MSDHTNNQDDPWAPMHHEDAEPDPTPATKPEQRARRTQSAPLGMIPVGMSIFVPPEVMDAIADLADSQREMAEQFADFTKTMKEWMLAQRGQSA